MIFLGADHRGFKLKEEIKKYLDEKGYKYSDCGAFSEERSDYPKIAKTVCDKMNKEEDKAILICGSGIGMCMAANKITVTSKSLLLFLFSARVRHLWTALQYDVRPCGTRDVP